MHTDTVFGLLSISLFSFSPHSRAEGEAVCERAEEGVQWGTKERVWELRWGGAWWWDLNESSFLKTEGTVIKMPKLQNDKKWVKKIQFLWINGESPSLNPSLSPENKMQTLTVIQVKMTLFWDNEAEKWSRETLHQQKQANLAFCVKSWGLTLIYPCNNTDMHLKSEF